MANSKAIIDSESEVGMIAWKTECRERLGGLADCCATTIALRSKANLRSSIRKLPQSAN